MIRVTVPATSANLGPGLDSLGLALGLYARFDVALQVGGLAITGCPAAYANQDNLVYRAYSAALAHRGQAPGGLRLHIQSDIPTARGLGSSAACVVAGIQAANALHHLGLTLEEQLALATALEGHPDNAAPALYGGLRVSLMAEGQVLSLPAPVHPDLRFLVLVPDFELSTSQARAALRPLVSLQDAVYNLSHAALLLRALETGSPVHLRAAMRDRLHQPARLALIPGGQALMDAAMARGALGCCLSGAGPSLLCLYTDQGFPHTMNAHINSGCPAWRALPLRLCDRGAASERMNPP